VRRMLLLAALPFFMGAAPADEDRQVSLTIYNSDLALVQDVRQLEVATGRSRLEFKDVSALIRPETVALSGNGLSIVEQNFDYDLLTPAKMMEKAVGKQIQIVRTNPATGKETPETATVLSVNEGVVLRIGSRIEVLRDDGIPTRVLFDGIPENLRARPTLSVTVDAQGAAGPRETTLSYLTSGLTWTADYVAQFDEKQSTIGLQGWITLSNKSGVSFNNAKTRLVAGNISAGPVYSPYMPRRPVANVRGGTGVPGESAQDFPIYTLPERVTVAESQTKQVSFLDIAGLKAKKIYEYRSAGFSSLETPAHAAVAVSFSNSGRALPAGTVRVYMRDSDGTAKFVGENPIDQTPANSELSVKLGEAFDVTAQPTLVSSEKISRSRTRYTMRYSLRNARGEPVTVDVRQGGLYGRDSEVGDESTPGRRIDAYTQVWSVPVPANGEAVLTYSATVGG
jgi:hypothetical protein